MSVIYAMSDIHGCLDAFEYALSLVDFSGDNKLILLGDYVHGPDSYGVLAKIVQLQNKYGSDKVIALLGNHEDMACDGRWPIGRIREENDHEHEWGKPLLYRWDCPGQWHYSCYKNRYRQQQILSCYRNGSLVDLTLW